MKIMLAMIAPRRAPLGPAADVLRLYLDRATHYTPTIIRTFPNEITLMGFVAEVIARTRPVLLLADSRGQQVSSEDLAAVVGLYQDNGIQQLIFAIGPADGWSPAALSRADKVIAFGRITLPHELAAIVAAEQLYRALTIRAGHPYHSGH